MGRFFNTGKRRTDNEQADGHRGLWGQGLVDVKPGSFFVGAHGCMDGRILLLWRMFYWYLKGERGFLRQD